jgi:hypothetical protein
MNSAYVVLGLLYGQGDLGKTMEIATRAGQDSDCNPATAGAILGTVIGYNNLPEYWTMGLGDVEDMDFQHTTTSLNDAYEISFNHALQMIERNGGSISEEEVEIKLQTPEVAPFEQSFPGYILNDPIEVGERFTMEGKQELEIEFEGVGIVVKGKVGNLDFENKYAMESEEETVNNYKLLVDFSIDDQEPQRTELPVWFIERAHELFYRYELEPGKHTLKMNIINAQEKIYLDVWNLITYIKE